MVVAALQIFLALLQLLVRVLLFRIVAKNCLVDHGVEDLLLPAVVLAAVRLQLAALLILAYEVARLPLLTDFKRIVLEKVRLPAEVLPVVGIHALGLVVFCVIWAPFSFEVKHIELLVAGHFVDQRGLYVLVAVSERTELLVLALLQRLGAELCLVFFNVIQALHFVVREYTIFFGA